jgi:lambda repressor-like predicted transcriptional regulator
MHPEQIKAELRMRGLTLAALADSLGISISTVSSVVAGYRTSAPVKEAVAGIIGKTVKEIWPQERPRLRRTRAEVEAARQPISFERSTL